MPAHNAICLLGAAPNHHRVKTFSIADMSWTEWDLKAENDSDCEVQEIIATVSFDRHGDPQHMLFDRTGRVYSLGGPGERLKTKASMLGHDQDLSAAAISPCGAYIYTFLGN